MIGEEDFRRTDSIINIILLILFLAFFPFQGCVHRIANPEIIDFFFDFIAYTIFVALFFWHINTPIE